MRNWQAYRSKVYAVAAFVIVVWAALALTAPPSSPGQVSPGPADTRISRECPPSAPNAAAGCLIARTP